MMHMCMRSPHARMQVFVGGGVYNSWGAPAPDDCVHVLTHHVVKWHDSWFGAAMAHAGGYATEALSGFFKNAVLVRVLRNCNAVPWPHPPLLLFTVIMLADHGCTEQRSCGCSQWHSALPGMAVGCCELRLRSTPRYRLVNAFIHSFIQ